MLQKNRFSKRIVMAFTLPELLVYMVVAGVVFLLVMEGFMLFRRLSEAKAADIAASSSFSDSYHRLASITYLTDSVAVDNYGSVSLFADSRLLAEIEKSDSLLILSRAGLTDTLFSCTSEMEVIVTEPIRYGTDTLSITLTGRNSPPLRLGFPIEPRHEKAIIGIIEENEKAYTYEPESDKAGSTKRHNNRL